MTMTMAIWAMVVLSRASQKARNAGILSGSGSRLTPGRLASGPGPRNCRLRFGLVESKALYEPWHGQTLDQDGEGHDHECNEDDRVALRHAGGDGECERQRQGAAQPAPEQGVLVGRRQTPARAAEQRR